ncbi:PREDICTED: peptidyl-tRNA hydrolase, chloroplastic isoform X1 [Tarenaya hassleriana]|uniref:peptidyl-tRNA hydrolase, chloroplastic isoform X1 n=1 Tax=Tarenaya hassleriana TaxID=28532 RepID=UPI00053C5733|nr:PREDICTED: peptidyl-tRNA hydrolase, chloroplastic isoform X1 [Tarenaya hassleriana]
MKAIAFPSVIASLSFPLRRGSLLFRSPATATSKPLFSSSFYSISSACWWLKRGRGRKSIGSNMSDPSTCASSCSLSSANPEVLVASTKQKSPPPQQPWLIIGLGNPGKKYNGTRHNVGFEMVDALAEAEGISVNSVNFKAFLGKGMMGNVPVMLAKPQTFMNASGESVGPIVSYYKIPLKQVLVIYDDLDLPFAKMRLLPKGGHGGHNGMRSIIDHFKGNRDFPRLRIGIGRPPGKMDTAAFVLRPFNKQEREELDFTFQTGLEAIRILLLEGFNKSATFVNSRKSIEQLG